MAPKKKTVKYTQPKIKVINPKEVDNMFLLENLHSRFSDSYKRWRNKALIFGGSHLAVAVIVIIVQCAQVVVFQIPDKQLSRTVKSAIATILPSITAAVLSLQMKLGWNKKQQKSKKSATLFNKLLKDTEYRIKMMEAGGNFKDVENVWNSGLVKETKEVPAFIMAY
ncbi:uncharacterized protein LOC104265910 [Ciona intestinalis]